MALTAREILNEYKQSQGVSVAIPEKPEDRLTQAQSALVVPKRYAEADDESHALGQIASHYTARTGTTHEISDAQSIVDREFGGSATSAVESLRKQYDIQAFESGQEHLMKPKVKFSDIMKLAWGKTNERVHTAVGASVVMLSNLRDATDITSLMLEPEELEAKLERNRNLATQLGKDISEQGKVMSESYTAEVSEEFKNSFAGQLASGLGEVPTLLFYGVPMLGQGFTMSSYYGEAYFEALEKGKDIGEASRIANGYMASFGTLGVLIDKVTLGAGGKALKGLKAGTVGKQLLKQSGLVILDSQASGLGEFFSETLESAYLQKRLDGEVDWKRAGTEGLLAYILGTGISGTIGSARITKASATNKKLQKLGLSEEQSTEISDKLVNAETDEQQVEALADVHDAVMEKIGKAQAGSMVTEDEMGVIPDPEDADYEDFSDSIEVDEEHLVTEKVEYEPAITDPITTDQVKVLRDLYDGRMEEMFQEGEMRDILQKAIRGDKQAIFEFNQRMFGKPEVEEKASVAEEIQPQPSLSVSSGDLDGIAPVLNEAKGVIEDITGEQLPDVEDVLPVVGNVIERQDDDVLGGAEIPEDFEGRTGLKLSEIRDVAEKLDMSNTHGYDKENFSEMMNDLLKIPDIVSEGLRVSEKQVWDSKDWMIMGLAFGKNFRDMTKIAQEFRGNEGVDEMLQPLKDIEAQLSVYTERASMSGKNLRAIQEAQGESIYSDPAMAVKEFKKKVGETPDAETLAEIGDTVDEHNRLLEEEATLRDELRKKEEDDAKVFVEDAIKDAQNEKPKEIKLGEFGEYVGDLTKPQVKIIQNEFKMLVYEGRAKAPEEALQIIKGNHPEVDSLQLLKAMGGLYKWQSPPKSSEARLLSHQKSEAKLMAKIDDAYNGIIEKAQKKEGVTSADEAAFKKDIDELQHELKQLTSTELWNQKSDERKKALTDNILRAENEINAMLRNYKYLKGTPDEVEIKLREDLSNLLKSKGLQDRYADVVGQIESGKLYSKMKSKAKEPSDLVKAWKARLDEVIAKRQELVLEATKEQRAIDKEEADYNRAVESLNYVLDQYQQMWRPIKQVREEQSERVRKTKKFTSEIRRIMRLEDGIADINAQIKSGNFYSAWRPPTEISERVDQLMFERIEARKHMNHIIYRSMPKTTAQKAIDALNMLRVTKMTADNSVMMVQLGRLLASNPKLYGETFIKSFKAMGNEEFANKQLNAIREHPLFKIAEESGYSLPDIEGTSTSRDEVYITDIQQKLGPITKYILNPSDRAMAVATATARFNLFKDQVDTGNFKTKDDLKNLMQYINISTGRGRLKIEGTVVDLESHQQVLGLFMTSARMLTANVERPFMLATLKGKATRNLMLKNAAKRVSALIGLYALWQLWQGEDSVDMNPESSTFLRIKLGDRWINPLGADMGMNRMIIRQIYSWGEEAGVWGDGENNFRLSKEARNYRMYRDAPWISFFYSMAEGKDWAGKEQSRLKTLSQAVLPISVSDVYDNMVESENNPLAKIAMASGAFIGVSSFKPSGREEKGKKRKGKQLINTF